MKFFEIEDDVITSESDQEIVEEDEIEEETPVKKEETPIVRKKKRVKENKEEASNRTVDDENPKNRCPYGHRFGIDIDEYDDCDNCELWDECADAER